MGQEKIQDFLNELPRMREDLPFSPRLLKRLFIQTGSNSTASLEEVGETLSKDQGLTTRILSLANSAYYGLQSEVQSVPRAAAVLGMGEIRNIVLALGVQSLTKQCDLPEDFSLGEYWQHQLLVGMAAREFSRMTDLGNPGNLFTVGLLHDVGKLITAMRRPEDWQIIHDLADDESLLDAEAEDRHWGSDHALVGSLVLSSWELPDELTEPVKWHHDPALSPAHSNESMIICLANYAIHAADDPEGPYVELTEEFCPELEMDFEEVMETTAELAESEEVEQFARLLA
ncbi:HDOD domain-containing protein [Pseudodesulfovibrio cashew]|uniref:HDOD domain-containing protein n=1 Tax=Pseudodesulfovibrio cashew TaxID=2678688 RepID=A0A6I6JK74_9BACT|nr:HDOD domain-containing protein [Pseudodesulfovibrio cashew]QGY40712.1 HDOD domain-containing protein [Pseudodesulfovibrio cashew]